jgi:hypothetical protein
MFQLLELARRAKVGRIINASTVGALLGKVMPPICEFARCRGDCSAFAGAYNRA